MLKMNSLFVMTFLPLCCASKQQGQKLCQICQGNTFKANKYFPVQPRCMSTDASQASNDFFPEFVRVGVCEIHKISLCPICNSENYIRRRVCNVVSGSLKRLNLKKNMSFLEYLGADSWPQVLLHLQKKRDNWNIVHPHAPMTWTNIDFDHIRPISSFKRNTMAAQKLLCNHYTNLQPLLHEDNNWKGEVWTLEDENFWHEHIILQPEFKDIYYPKTAPSQPSLLNTRPLVVRQAQ
jgi:hypothetical protein